MRGWRHVCSSRRRMRNWRCIGGAISQRRDTTRSSRWLIRMAGWLSIRIEGIDAARVTAARSLARIMQRIARDLFQAVDRRAGHPRHSTRLDHEPVPRLHMLCRTTLMRLDLRAIGDPLPLLSLLIVLAL